MRRQYIFIAAVVVAVAGFLILRESNDYPEGGESAPAAVVDIKLGDFMDWNLAKPGPLGDEIRSLVTERLFELGGDGRYVYRLGSVLNVKGPVAKVTLRDGVYWSDQVQLTAGQVVDAWQRLVASASSDPSVVDDPVERQWLSVVTIKDVGKLQLEITGYSTIEELSRLVRSRFLVPIRKDLLDLPGGEQSAWLVTIGRYRLAAIPPATLPSTSFVEFIPNPTYYGGAPQAPMKVSLSK